MNVAMYFSVGIGYIAGVVAMFFVGRRIVMAVLRSGPFETAQRKTILRVAAAGGLIALVPALLLGTVVGGTLGGAYGEALLRSVGAGASGVILGIAVGMFAVVALVLCLAIAAGAYIGKFIAHGDNAAI